MTLSLFIQAALLCKPVLDSLKEFISLPQTAKAVTYTTLMGALCKLTLKNVYKGGHVEERLCQAGDIRKDNLDIDEAVKLIDKDFPGIYKDYVMASFEDSLRDKPCSAPGR